MLSVLLDGVIYGKQVRGGVGRLFEEIVPRIAASKSAGVRFLLRLPDAIQRLPESLQESDRLTHFKGSRVSGRWLPWGLAGIVNARLGPRLEKRSLRRLGALKPDLFHTSYYTLPPLPGLKSIVSAYDFIDESSFESMSGNSPGFVAAKRKSLESADAVIAISEATRQDILAYTKVDESRIHVIPLGASDVFAQGGPVPEEETALVRRQYRIAGPYWVYLGRRNPYKNFSALLRAWRLFRDRTKIDSWLVICGVYGDLQRHEMDFLLQHGLEKRVVMARQVDDRRLRAIYAGSAAFLFPSLYEGFGIPILEAFGCHAPCILSGIRVFREVAGDAALFFEPYSDESFAAAMEEVLRPGAREALTAKGLQQLAKYSWEKNARQTAELYKSLA